MKIHTRESSFPQNQQYDGSPHQTKNRWYAWVDEKLRGFYGDTEEQAIENLKHYYGKELDK